MNSLNIFLKNLDHNFYTIKSKLKNSTKLIGVVKANAYGSDSLIIAKRLESLGIDMIAVAYTSEGIYLKKNKINIPILVFYPQLESLKELYKYRLEPAIYSKLIFKKFNELIEEKSYKKYPIHIKYNTGLNRIGFNSNETTWIIKSLNKSSLALKSVYSHLSMSEEKKPSKISEKQINVFKNIIENYQNNKNIKPFFHLLNSSGIFNYPNLELDAVRPGISLYGYANNFHWDKKLLPISSLTTKIFQIHKIKKGESVGYNKGWFAKRNSKIGVIPIGHADGIPRSFGMQKGWFTIKNKKAYIIGNVCMDIIMIDITEINCKVGDKAILFGNKISAASIAENCNTISYELLSNISNRIPRNFIEN